MSPVARKRGLYVAGLLGAAAAGFLSHWVAPRVVREAPAAQALPDPALEARLRAIETVEAAMLKDIGEIKRIVGYLECRSNVNNVCPPPERGR